MKVGNLNTDNFDVECFVCGRTRGLSMKAIRKSRGIVGWVFVCKLCEDILDASWNKEVAMVEFGDRESGLYVLAEQLLRIAQEGDYSNGVEFYGVDEGRSRAAEVLTDLEAELKRYRIGSTVAPRVRPGQYDG